MIEIYYEGLSHTMLVAKKSHHLPSGRWRPRKWPHRGIAEMVPQDGETESGPKKPRLVNINCPQA